MNRTVLILIVIIVVVVGGGGAFLLLNGGPSTGDGDTTQDSETESVRVSATPEEPTATATPATVVVIAIQDIPRGVIITPEMVDEVVFPAEFAPQSAYTNKNDVIGLIAATNIVREEIIIARKLVQDFNSLGRVGSAAAAVLEPGRVAIAVPMDRLTSVAYALEPGDFVDIIVSMLFVDVETDFQTILPNKFRLITGLVDAETGVVTLTVGEPNSGELDTRTLIVPAVGASLSSNFSVLVEPSEAQRPRLLTVRTVTGAQVVWVGEFPEDGQIFRPQEPETPTPAATADPNADTAANADGPPTATPKPPRPDIITLAVLPQDAVIMSYMIEAKMPLTFVLRSARAQGLPNTDPVTLSYIMGRYGVLPPDRFNYAIEPTLHDIRSLTLENITVPSQ
jgi:pilus assembly protein CpaB